MLWQLALHGRLDMRGGVLVKVWASEQSMMLELWMVMRKTMATVTMARAHKWWLGR